MCLVIHGFFGDPLCDRGVSTFVKYGLAQIVLLSGM